MTRSLPLPYLAVDNAPLREGLAVFNDEERALLWFWLMGVNVDVGFEILAWSRIMCANNNGMYL